MQLSVNFSELGYHQARKLNFNYLQGEIKLIDNITCDFMYARIIVNHKLGILLASLK